METKTIIINNLKIQITGADYQTFLLLESAQKMLRALETIKNIPECAYDIADDAVKYAHGGGRS